ncbi:hypothetical protein ACQ4PT_000982 [Festuca glaucescens]
MIDGSNGSSSSISPVRPGPPRQLSAQDVDEEYGRAFKSRSFLDLWSHAHRSLRHTLSSYKLSSRLSSSFNDDEVPANEEPSCSYTVLNDFVLEPSPETLTRPGHRRSRRCQGRRRVETLLLEYFDVTREGLRGVLRAASGRRSRAAAPPRAPAPPPPARRRRRRSCRSRKGRARAAHWQRQSALAGGRRLTGFNDAHARCAPLSRRLVAARRRLRRLARAARIAQCAAATAIVGASAAAVVTAAVVLAAHAVVGIGAAAALTFCATSTTRPSARRTSAIKKLSRRCHRGRRRRHARAGEEAAVDAAARGAYILGRDLDTVSRMVRRAHDELEHGRDMARIAVAAGAHGGERPPLLLQEVAREEECGEDLRCQLEELEEHACLCLLTINRSRRIVTQVMTKPDDGSASTETTSQD